MGSVRSALDAINFISLKKKKEVCKAMLSEALVEKLTKELKTFFGTELASVVLYGSYAEGKETKYSDIDILVVVRRQFEDRSARRACEIALRKRLYQAVGQVSPRVISTEILFTTLRNFNPLLLNILKHGIPLLDDGTFATLKAEFQRMVNAKILQPKEDYWMVATT
jgi:predicted nucleotidyltransferase